MLSGSIRMEGMQKHQYWMDKESLALVQLSGFQLSLFFLLFVCKAGKVFDYKPHFPHSNLSVIRITYMLKVLCVANSNKNPKFSNYIHIVKLSVSNCVIHFSYINKGKSRIISIFLTNYGI